LGSIIEILVTGKVVEDNSDGTINDTYISNFAQFNPDANPDTVETLILITDLGTGEIKEITVKDTDGESISVPIISIEYEIMRYKHKDPNYSGDPYEYEDKLWQPLNPIQGEGRWNNDIRETYIKSVYWSDVNKDIINSQSGHID